MTPAVTLPRGEVWVPPLLGLAVSRGRPHLGAVHAARLLIDALSRGRVRDVADVLADGVVLDDPRNGRVSGAARMRRWLDETAAWLAKLGARPEAVRLTASGRQAVGETIVHVRVDGERRELPVAVAAESDDRGRLRAVRIYHSFWPLEHKHCVRPPVLPERWGLVLHAPVDRYHRALAEGDIDAVLACFEPRGARVCEPAGGPWVHRGAAGLRRLYGGLLWDGGIRLRHCAAVDDGVACAVEYVVTRWGRRDVPPQAGVAVYERGRSGLLAEARIYDDVDPPRG